MNIDFPIEDLIEIKHDKEIIVKYVTDWVKQNPYKVWRAVQDALLFGKTTKLDIGVLKDKE